MTPHIDFKCECGQPYSILEEKLVGLASHKCHCGREHIELIIKLRSPETVFISKAIKARQLACELRNLLEELDADQEAASMESFPPNELEDMAGDVEYIEEVFDKAFPLDTYPTTDPSTWKEPK